MEIKITQYKCARELAGETGFVKTQFIQQHRPGVLWIGIYLRGDLGAVHFHCEQSPMRPTAMDMHLSGIERHQPNDAMENKCIALLNTPCGPASGTSLGAENAYRSFINGDIDGVYAELESYYKSWFEEEE